MGQDLRRTWNEFQWDREIRKDEMRIAGYFKNLGAYLDLPGEDELIFTRLMGEPELVPTGCTDPRRMMDAPFVAGDDDFESDMEDAADAEDMSVSDGLRHRNGYNFLVRLEHMASEWNLLVVNAHLSRETFREALAINCALGKVTARLLNFLEAEAPGESAALRVSLSKYLLQDMNDLCSMLQTFETVSRTFREAVSTMIHTLQLIRTGMIDYGIFPVKSDD